MFADNRCGKGDDSRVHTQTDSPVVAPGAKSDICDRLVNAALLIRCSDASRFAVQQVSTRARQPAARRTTGDLVDRPTSTPRGYIELLRLGSRLLRGSIHFPQTAVQTPRLKRIRPTTEDLRTGSGKSKGAGSTAAQAVVEPSRSSDGSEIPPFLRTHLWLVQ